MKVLMKRSTVLLFENGRNGRVDSVFGSFLPLGVRELFSHFLRTLGVPNFPYTTASNTGIK